MLSKRHVKRLGIAVIGSILAYNAFSSSYPTGVLPPKNIGLINEKLTVQELCSPTFRTGELRPSTYYTNQIKKDKLTKTNYPNKDLSFFELDHLLPIFDGGDPASPDNLWPEPWHINYKGYDLGAKTKDRLEVKIHKDICDGKLDFNGALKLMKNWPSAYKKYIGEWPKYSLVSGIDTNDE